MIDESRPSPESFIAALAREKNREGRGKFKLFFGMCAGVGKTYSMLEAARALKSRGADIRIGIIETHGRAETEKLLEGIPVIPRKPISHHGIALQELDLDEVLRGHPDYVLIDELAHTNAEGMRHVKRYQDVLEILDHGINVFSTLNVQHLESLVDTVNSISGIMVRETVPDTILDAADEIELVDLSPEDLLQRFAEGKVYTPERSAAAIAHFFRIGTLTALREIALRATAQRVDLQLKNFMQEQAIEGPWKTVERLMVAVGPSPWSEQLIRWTKRIAGTMQAPWVAVYIQTGTPLEPEEEKRLRKNITLAQELGATIVTTTDNDIAQALLRTAKANNVSQIIVGKSRKSMFIDLWRGGSLVDRLIRDSGEIDIYVVQAGDAKAASVPLTWSKRLPTLVRSSPPVQYALALGSIIAAAVFCLAVADVIDYRSIGMFFLFVITVLAPFVGPGPLFSAAATSAVLWDFLFIRPRFTFTIANSTDFFLVFLYFLIASVTTVLNIRIRRHREAVHARERQSAALYRLVNDLLPTESLDDIAKVAVQHIGGEFGARVSFYSAEPGTEIDRKPNPASSFNDETENEWSVAEWVYGNKQPAGKGTATLPFARASYYPLISQENCYGVVGILTPGTDIIPFVKEGHLRMSLQQVALSLERMHLRADHLSRTFLNSISHEIRTPITAIMTASSALADPLTRSNSRALDLLVDDIGKASGRLNRVVENLLNMTRIESDSVIVHREWFDVRELFHTLVYEFSGELENHPVKLGIPENMPLVEADPVLLRPAISNLLINAAQYTPPGTEIILSASYKPATLVLTVEDAGPGLPPDSVGRLFEKFYRIPGSKPGGTGLGLSIVKAFIELQGGTVEASNRETGGARFAITIPVKHKEIG